MLTIYIYVLINQQGLKSTSDERGTSALSAMKLDDDLGGEAIQVRIICSIYPC